MRRVAACLVGLAVGASAFGAEPQWGLKLGALAGAPIADGQDRSSRVTVEPSLKIQSGDWTWRAESRLRHLELQGEATNRGDWRELTVTRRSNTQTLSLGAQQVNWGRMDLLRVTDAVNPVDQQDLFLEELPESKLALWMVNWEWQQDARSVQVIVAPQVAVDRVPQSIGGLPVTSDRPAASPQTATYAARYGFEAGGWNTDLVAIRGWQSTPSFSPAPAGTGLRLRPQFRRQDAVGLSADRPVGSIVLRLEGLLARSRPYDPPPGSPAERRRHAALGLGADVTEGDWFFALQVIGQREFDAEPGHRAFVSAIVQRKWLQDRLSLRGVHLRETGAGSSWTSLQLGYELSPNQELRLQADAFDGAAAEPFGAYAGRSRIAVALKARY